MTENRCALTVLLFACALVANGGAAAGAASAAGGGTRLASVSRSTDIDILGTTVVWDSYRSGVGYRLMARYGGRTRLLPVRPRSVPFDSDLGTDRKGRVVVTYSRCRHEKVHERTPTGCTLHVYTFRSGGERILRRGERRGFSRVLPSMWRGRLAYATYHDPADRQVPETHQLRVISSDGAIRRVGGGTRKDPAVADPDGVAARLDLRGEQVTFSWAYQMDCRSLDDDDLFFPFGTEIWKARVGHRSQRLATACTKTTGSLFDPRLDNRGLSYLFVGLDAAQTVLLREIPAQGAAREQQLPPMTVSAAAYGSVLAYVQQRASANVFDVFVRERG